jgi:hypothetical protein
VYAPAARRSTIRIAAHSCIITLTCRSEADLQENPEARFTLAHELGHLILFRYGVSRPQTKKEYWIQEGLCDQFAREVLCPVDVFSKAEPKPSSIRDAMLLAERLAADYRVPLRAACDNVSQWAPEFRFAVIRRERDCLRVTASSFNDRKVRGTRLSVQDPVKRVLTTIRRQAEHRVLSSAECQQCRSRFKLGEETSEFVAARLDAHTWLLGAQMNVHRMVERTDESGRAG